jgi:hypothetical protein
MTLKELQASLEKVLVPMTRSLLPAMAALLLAFSAAHGAEGKGADSKPPSPTKEPAPKASEPAPSVPETDAKAMEKLLSDNGPLAEVMKAGTSAPQGATLCETAYNGMKAMAEALKKSMPEAQKKLPSKDKFVAVCKDLPEGAQKCLVISYAQSHLVECAQTQQALDPAMLEKIKKLAE